MLCRNVYRYFTDYQPPSNQYDKPVSSINNTNNNNNNNDIEKLELENYQTTMGNSMEHIYDVVSPQNAKQMSQADERSKDIVYTWAIRRK